jgi:hypothetical protein
MSISVDSILTKQWVTHHELNEPVLFCYSPNEATTVVIYTPTPK